MLSLLRRNKNRKQSHAIARRLPASALQLLFFLDCDSTVTILPGKSLKWLARGMEKWISKPENGRVGAGGTCF